MMDSDYVHVGNAMIPEYTRGGIRYLRRAGTPCPQVAPSLKVHEQIQMKFSMPFFTFTIYN
jgi:hypothetical protein